jgi:glycosyltransferase involved in cell wall biosynthesis
MTLSKVRRHHPDVMAVIVGDGSIRPELETQAAALGLGDDVVFAGNRDQMWIASALSEAAVVVSPLTGRALVEASLSGTPIVAYDAEWQPEFIESGTTGLIVAFRDTDAMAAAVDRLLNDDNLATRLAHAARAKTITGWDPQANKAERRDTLARVIDTGTGRRKRRRLW